MKSGWYDLSQPRELANGDTEFLEQLLTLGLTEIRQDLSGLREAVEPLNDTQLHFYLHKLCSSTRMFGLKGSDELKSLHHKLNEMQTTGIQHQLMEIVQTLDRAMVELEKDNL
jgi:HPt (histidine-containing phosphotransfer) domain-containing protein